MDIDLRFFIGSAETQLFTITRCKVVLLWTNLFESTTNYDRLLSVHHDVRLGRWKDRVLHVWLQTWQLGLGGAVAIIADPTLLESELTHGHGLVIYSRLVLHLIVVLHLLHKEFASDELPTCEPFIFIGALVAVLVPYASLFLLSQDALTLSCTFLFTLDHLIRDCCLLELCSMCGFVLSSTRILLQDLQFICFHLHLLENMWSIAHRQCVATGRILFRSLSLLLSELF